MFEYLHTLKNLRTLQLNFAVLSIKNAFVILLATQLGRMKSLRWLWLNFRETELENDQGFYELSEAIEYLVHLNKLELDFTYTKVTELGLKAFSTSLKSLENISHLKLSFAYTQ